MTLSAVSIIAPYFKETELSLKHGGAPGISPERHGFIAQLRLSGQLCETAHQSDWVRICHMPTRICALYLMESLGDTVVIVDGAEDFGDLRFFSRVRARNHCRSEVMRLAFAPSRSEISGPYESHVFEFHERRGLLAVAAVVTRPQYPALRAQVILRALLDERDVCKESIPNQRYSVVHDGIVQFQDPENVLQLMTPRECIDEAHYFMVQSLDLPLTPGDTIEHMLEQIAAAEPKKERECCVA
jgi:hypothetical protein